MQFALVQQNQLHLSTLKLTLYCLGLLCSLNPKPSQCTLLIIKLRFGQVLFLPESSIINANILFYSELPAKLLFSGSSGRTCTEGKGGKRGGWGMHTSQIENWDMLESVSKKAPALRDAPNAASPITAQLHIHLRTCRPEEHAALKLVLSSYQWSELFFSLSSAVYTTCPSVLLLYYFIFSLFPP